MVTEQVSWLMLERYWLSELRPAEKARVELALDQSEELRRCLEKIRSDVGRPLPPLPEVRAPVLEQRTPRRWFERWSGLVAATAGIVAIVGVWSVWTRARVGSRDRPKGDAVVLELARESGGAVVEDASVFVEGDVFKIRVTCSRQGPVSWQVSVFQGNDVYFPLPSSQPIHCGNRVVLPGAFRVSANAPALVCLSLDEAIVSAERLAKEGIEALPATAVCTHLRPLGRP